MILAAVFTICMAAPPALQNFGPPLICADVTVETTPPMRSQSECETIARTLAPDMGPWTLIAIRCEPALAGAKRGA